jgi:2-polyprenyl-3-methyl-5-hydroxy-6-metoxy-1,4-benzoquinol methylase
MPDEKVMREEKSRVKNFYETFGWRRNASGRFNDAELFSDPAATLRPYRDRTGQRVQRYLPRHGTYFLDAGSGPVGHDFYVPLSSGYKRRVCVDFSELALREARARLGTAGCYVCADITRLPFKDGVFDAIFSAHVLYHIPADEQEQAITELQRSLSAGRVGVIIYSSPNPWFTALAEGVNSAKRRLDRVPGLVFLWRMLHGRRAPVVASRPDDGVATAASRPNLYFHKHPYHWLVGRSRADCVIEVRCFSAVDYEFTRTLVPSNAVGRWLMNAIYMLEELCPRLLARIGCYPMLIMTKRPLERAPR